MVHLKFSTDLSPRKSEPAPVKDRLCRWRKARNQFSFKGSLVHIRMANLKLLHIVHRTGQRFTAALRRQLLGAAPEDAPEAGIQLLFGGIAVAHKVLRCVVNSVVHQIDCRILVIEMRPGAQVCVWPCCLGSGLQLLIRGRMPSRIGPAPSQVLPVATSWRHSRVCARGGD